MDQCEWCGLDDAGRRAYVLEHDREQIDDCAASRTWDGDIDLPTAIEREIDTIVQNRNEDHAAGLHNPETVAARTPSPRDVDHPRTHAGRDYARAYARAWEAVLGVLAGAHEDFVENEVR
jgi:hypothetical protein